MKLKIFFLVIVVLNFSFPLFSQEANELILKGDELYSEIRDMAMAKEALAKYQEALLKLEDKYEVYWRMARILCYIGIHTENKKDKDVVFSQGIYNAKKAVELKPEKPDGHFWLGVNYGAYSEVKGVLKSLSLVKLIKQEMNRVIELDPTYNDGGAYALLGRVYFKLPSFAGGNKEKSLEYLLRAKELGPNDVLTRLYLAETYLSLGQKDKAKKELEYILNMEDDSRWVFHIIKSKADAEKMLQRKEFKGKS